MKTLESLKQFRVTFYFISFILSFMIIQNVYGQSFKDNKSLKDLDDLLNLTVVGNGYSDQTIILFIPGATEGFDSEYDAYKLTGIYAAPQFYSIIPCCNLAVNALPPPVSTNYWVQMGFDVGYDTTYTITASGFNSFNPFITFHLLDSRDNVLINLLTDSVYTFTANPDDCSKRFRLYFNLTSQFLNVKVQLEGPFNGNDMNTDLKAGGYVPTSQPYNTSPWNYNGTESSGVPVDAVDWVLVELRDATDAASAHSGTIIERQAGLLMKDGNIKFTDGCSIIDFSSSYSNNLFVVIWHRNHLPVLSNNPVLITNGVHSYDFSIAAGQAYGGAAAQKFIGLIVYGMMGGDANADGYINTDDGTNVWSLEAGESGYLPSDVTLDGQANNQDKDDIWVENEGESSQLP